MEIRDLYDENKNLTGKTFIKGEQVPLGYYYLIVIIFIQNDNGEFLIQKRVKRKGDKWATTGGHPKSGETSREGIISETKEELGINISNENLTLFDTVTFNDQFFDLYYLNKNININEIAIQEYEVDGVKWASIEEIKNMYKNNEFHEGHYNMFLMCLDYLNRK